MRAMKEEIERALQVLVGLPLTGAGRTAGLAWFQFGVLRDAEGRFGHKKVGAFALHVQVTWRIIGPTGIVVAWNDRFFAAGEDPYLDYDNFDWEPPGANRCDERMNQFFAARAQTPVVVESVAGDAVGGFRLMLTDGFALEAFPDTSLEGENWRLFQPDTKDRHFVVTGVGIKP